MKGIKEISLEKISNLVFFENRLDDEKGNYIVLSDGYLWRRDSVRLFSYKIDSPIEGVHYFNINDLSDFIERDVEIIFLEGKLFVKENNEIIREFESVKTEFKDNSLRCLDVSNFDSVFELNSKQIAKILLIAQRKVLNLNIDLNKVTLNMNLEKKKIILEAGEKFFEYECDILFKEKGNLKEISFSYILFRDFLSNVNSFGKKVEFSVYGKFFSLIKYNENISTVINHKRKNDLET